MLCFQKSSHDSIRIMIRTKVLRARWRACRLHWIRERVVETSTAGKYSINITIHFIQHSRIASSHMKLCNINTVLDIMNGRQCEWLSMWMGGNVNESYYRWISLYHKIKFPSNITHLVYFKSQITFRHSITHRDLY